MTAPAVQTVALTKAYGSVPALVGLDLEVPVGTVMGLIGPNGAGKTTTLRILLDLVRPTSGRVRVLGSDPRDGGPALRRRVGYLPGELALQGRVTGRSLLRYYAAISGPVVTDRSEQLADRFGLDLGRQVRTLSKGNKQKLGLVQAFLHEPELLVLDEPSSGLDPLVQQEFLALVREVRDAGRTVLLSSHVLSEIEHAADHVAVLRDGRIISDTDTDVATLRRRAVRRVRVRTADGSPAQLQAVLAALPTVSDVRADHGVDHGVEASAVVEGDTDALVKALAGFTTTDLVVTEPDLEQAVLRLYSAGATTAVRADRHPRHARADPS